MLRSYECISLGAVGDELDLGELFQSIERITATPAATLGKVNMVAFSPDGSRLVSTSDDETVRMWDVSTEVEVQKLEVYTGGVNAVAFSPNRL